MLSHCYATIYVSVFHVYSISWHTSSLSNRTCNILAERPVQSCTSGSLFTEDDQRRVCIRTCCILEHSDTHTLLLQFLSAQCISSIGQIIKSVCVSVSESVSQWVRHTKRVERSTDRNLPPIFTKLATKVESWEMWLLIVFGGNLKYFYSPNRKWN